MSLETASFIHQLTPANPSGADRLHQGDDHIRLIKQVLKNTFPSITGPVTVSQDQLNSVFGSVVPVGVINAWYGSSGAIPGGWALCDGTTVPRSDGSGNITVPDLRGKVILGALAGTYVQGTAYGQATQSSLTTSSGGEHTHTGSTSAAGAHNHGGAVGGTSLSVSQLPSHNHANGVGNTDATIYAYGTTSASTSGEVQQNGSTPGNIQGYTSSVGSGETHSHSLNSQGDHTHTMSLDAAAGHTHTVPAFGLLQPSLALHYIMKI